MPLGLVFAPAQGSLVLHRPRLENIFENSSLNFKGQEFRYLVKNITWRFTGEDYHLHVHWRRLSLRRSLRDIDARTHLKRVNSGKLVTVLFTSNTNLELYQIKTALP